MWEDTVSAFWYWGGGNHNAAEQISGDRSVHVRQAMYHPFPLLTPLLPSLPLFKNFPLCISVRCGPFTPMPPVYVHLFLTFILETLYVDMSLITHTHSHTHIHTNEMLYVVNTFRSHIRGGKLEAANWRPQRSLAIICRSHWPWPPTPCS